MYQDAESVQKRARYSKNTLTPPPGGKTSQQQGSNAKKNAWSELGWLLKKVFDRSPDHHYLSSSSSSSPLSRVYLVVSWIKLKAAYQSLSWPLFMKGQGFI
ncbi:predicted protein [Sclerotinia sclerotiorum 1980 UF-70]|uniref:Uncharacterized protein n=1 Tax=Sclerotinia sclerotiorum (strain ATCC 18683 / 1980 / Ss-1) TaxID=665079 RepID=A7ES49_SCLS1|nr:predicted protein [Sclerotinia sclerotiorum 1980 UF-70]EDN92291.1 predicted protein [Sclerotinia sclerotiorum 1980 UF-70]